MRTPRSGGRLVLATAIATLVLTACTSGTSSEAPSTVDETVAATAPADLVNPDAAVDGPITIGYLDYPSSRLMAEVYGKALVEAGYAVQLTVAGTNADFLRAMAAGKVDIVAEYVEPFAQALNVTVNGPDAARLEVVDVARSLAAARDLATPLGITVLDATPAAETIEYAVSTDFSKENGIRTLSELAEWSKANPLRMGGDVDCEASPLCLLYLQETYGLVVKDYAKVTADGAVIKDGLLSKGFEVGFLTGTDPLIDSPEITVLEKDIPQVTVGNLAPAVRTVIATPELVAALNDVTAKVGEEELGVMLRAQTIDGVPSARVAGEFLDAQGLGQGLYSGATKVVGVDMPRELEPVPPAPASEGPLRISSSPSTDAEIAARVYAGALVNAGIPVAVGDPQDPAELLAALQSGEVQFVPSRLSPVANFLNTEANGNLTLPIEGRDVNRIVAQARELAGPRGLEILNASTANVSSAWAVNKDFVANTGITTLSELAEASQSRPVVLGGPATCPQDEWCQPFLREQYGIKFGQFQPLDYGGGLTRGAIDSGAVDVAWLSGNDGGIEEFGFTVLKDDLGREPANPITPVLNASAVTPEIEEVLNKVSAQLSTEELKELNYAIEFERREITDVVAEWLDANGFG